MTDLTGYTTRRLLMMKNACYREDYDEENYGIKPSTDPTHAEIMAELDTRPHVPNKIEAKKIRQDRAKKGNRKNHKKS